MADTPTVQEVVDFKTDINGGESFVNSTDLTFESRLSGTKKTITGLSFDAAQGNVTVFSAAATYTLITNWVDFGGVIYRPKPSALPIGPAAFDPADWFLAQYLKTQEFDSMADLLNARPYTDRVYILEYTAGTNVGGHTRVRSGTTGTPGTIVGGIAFDGNGDGWATDSEYFSCDDYAELRANMSAGYYSDGDVVKVTDDGIFGDFYIHLDASGGTPNDGGIRVTESGTTTLPNEFIAIRRGVTMANLLWWGVSESAASNTAAYNLAVSSGAMHFYLPKGTYAGSFDMGNNQILEGAGAKNATVMTPPVGGGYVVRVDAKTSAKQHCQIKNLSIRNPSLVANCDAILFDGVDVFSINDNHRLENMYIRDFRYGVHILGRQILSLYKNVEIEHCTRSMNVNVDPAGYAFNANIWDTCKFAYAAKEGVKITGFNQVNTFINCNIENNNGDQVAGVAGFDVENPEALSFPTTYFELNGRSMAVDAGNPLNNSVGLRIRGNRCFNLEMGGGWIVQSGVDIMIDSGVTCWGGHIKGLRLSPESGGWSFYCDAAGSFDRPSIALDTDNYITGKVEIVQQGTGQFGAHLRQSGSSYYLTSALALDLLACSDYTCASTLGFTIATIKNRIPGASIRFFNTGVGTITIDAALMDGGVAATISSNKAKAFLVGGYPASGKLVEIGA